MMFKCAGVCWWLCLALIGSRALAQPNPERLFQLPADALAFANQLSSIYEFDPASGKMIQHARSPKPDYTLHCFVVVRTARQFFEHARFESNEPRSTPAEYRHLVRLIVAKNPRSRSSDAERIVIPGYANLHEFSQDNEALLKTESGGTWQSYLQRGNWRMVFPFSRRHQTRTAERLVQELQKNRPPVVHLVCFPALTLNHALLVSGSKRTDDGIAFTAYDPNNPTALVQLSFRHATGKFHFPRTTYFAGGPVKVYEIYRGFCF
jgi:hypothetical protein